ncbi:uncharacterized protein LY89DRAFT_692203 [Mollisia scopiformis]|uniref:Uncharacterized protein n=1 Tax=Mollisia scopiformis TaxID=149040 RepID=A0A132B4L4_MOLSC|nr:uncharacterized protein LY89DRAFT_692203 [Mollisia scopiformis]KUJ06854.1 hypothetical protein LY89DRAFT_692203 [Mollisia scopiformis]
MEPRVFSSASASSLLGASAVRVQCGAGWRIQYSTNDRPRQPGDGDAGLMGFMGSWVHGLGCDGGTLTDWQWQWQWHWNENDRESMFVPMQGKARHRQVMSEEKREKGKGRIATTQSKHNTHRLTPQLMLIDAML